jgi:hypothetical protein
VTYWLYYTNGKNAGEKGDFGLSLFSILWLSLVGAEIKSGPFNVSPSGDAIRVL